MEKTNEVIQGADNKITSATVLFFDMDGTLVDTNLANFLSYEKAIKSVTRSDFNLTYNPGKRFTRSNLKNAIPNLSVAEYERIIQEKEKCYRDFLPEIKLNEAIAKLLFKYSKTNETVLVTNCREDRVLTTLNYFELADKFDSIFCRQINNKDKKANKFKNAISILGVHPHLVVAFENEEIEIADAIEAGIKIINPEIA